MQRSNIVLCVVILSSLLSGCASTFIGSYKEPDEGPVAEITVRNGAVHGVLGCD